MSSTLLAHLPAWRKKQELNPAAERHPVFEAGMATNRHLIFRELGVVVISRCSAT